MKTIVWLVNRCKILAIWMKKLNWFARYIIICTWFIMFHFGSFWFIRVHYGSIRHNPRQIIYGKWYWHQAEEEILINEKTRLPGAVPQPLVYSCMCDTTTQTWYYHRVLRLLYTQISNFNLRLLLGYFTPALFWSMDSKQK